MTREEAIEVLENATIEPTWGGSFRATSEALKMAIEALKREGHDGCDGCRYEMNPELSLPCVGCKQNYVDKYVPMPNHDRDWIVGCIKHDGFIKTDRGDKANQIILEALKADRPRGEWIEMGENKDGTHNIRCNQCGESFKARGHANSYNTKKKYRFCPHCGVDMRGEDK